MSETKKLLIDINHAPIEALTSLSGIGESLAQKIVDQRPFIKLQDLVKIPGINEAKLGSLLPNITLSTPKSKKPSPSTISRQVPVEGNTPITTIGNTEAFVFLEDRNERQDALLIIFGGFILGLIILMLRRSNN